jgi:Predicted hydrolase of the alpha/beta superfamily
MRQTSLVPHTPDGWHEFPMTSRAGLDYRILFSVPEEPPPDSGYAIVYMLDGDALFRTLAEALQAELERGCGRQPSAGFGAEELEDMPEGVEIVAERTAPLVCETFNMEKVLFSGEEHASVLPALLGRIPKFLSAPVGRFE